MKAEIDGIPVVFDLGTVGELYGVRVDCPGQSLWFNYSPIKLLKLEVEHRERIEEYVREKSQEQAAEHVSGRRRDDGCYIGGADRIAGVPSCAEDVS